MQFILLISPQDAEKLALIRRYGSITPCYTGFYLKRDGTVARPVGTIKGGSCAIGIDNVANFDPEKIENLLREHDFSGVYLSSARDLSPAVSVLARSGFAVYTDSEKTRGGIHVISSALSGGTLRERLSDEIACRGAERVVLGIELVRCDFMLPAKGGNGRELTLSDTRELLNRHPSPSFFSEELCTNYFFYRNGKELHAVLFDNRRSIAAKIRLAESLGIRSCFMAYDEVEEILPNLIGLPRYPHGQRF